MHFGSEGAVLFKIWILVVALFVPVQARAQGGVRAPLALVIGNSAYRGSTVFPLLPNAIRDAQLAEGALERLGFKVTLVQDANRSQIVDSVKALVDQAAALGSSTVVVYYAGHGLGIGDSNYLIPLQLASTEKAELEASAVTTYAIASELRRSGAANVFMFIDACRTDPDAGNYRGPGARKRIVLVPEKQVANVRILFSTSPFDTASDGPRGQHSPFAEAFATEIIVPNQDLGSFIQAVSRRVSDATAQAQHVWTSGPVASDRPFCFAGCGTNNVVGTALSNPDIDKLREVNAKFEYFSFLKAVLGDTPEVSKVYTRCPAGTAMREYCIFTTPYGWREGSFDEKGDLREGRFIDVEAVVPGNFPADFLILFREFNGLGDKEPSPNVSPDDCQLAYPLMTKRQCMQWVTERQSDVSRYDGMGFVAKRLDEARQRPLIFDPLIDDSGKVRKDVRWKGPSDRGKRDGCGMDWLADGRIVMGCFIADDAEGVVRVIDPGKGWWLARFRGGRLMAGHLSPGPLVGMPTRTIPH